MFKRWTQRLEKAARTQHVLPARVQGPFDGETLTVAALARYSLITVVAGGSGLAGVMAMLRRIELLRRDTLVEIPPVTLVFSARSAGELQVRLYFH